MQRDTLASGCSAGFASGWLHVRERCDHVASAAESADEQTDSLAFTGRHIDLVEQKFDDKKDEHTIQRIARIVGGRTYYSKAWYMRAQVNGCRSWFKLGADLKKAKAKACEIANSIGAGGITAQLGYEQSKVKQPKGAFATLGELIDGIELSTGVFEMAKASTVHEYLCSVKLIVREVSARGRIVSVQFVFMTFSGLHQQALRCRPRGNGQTQLRCLSAGNLGLRRE